MSDQLAQDVVRQRRLADKLRRIRFELRWIRKRQFIKRRQSLSTPHEYYRFARKVFSLVQIEKEITGFVEWAGQISPRVACEIGTRTCGTSFLLSQLIPSVEQFIGLDLFVENWSRMQRFARPGQSLACFSGSSYDPATVDQVRKMLAGRPIDLLFIDGDHSYEGAKKDFLIYSPLVREGGVIAFHDIVPIQSGADALPAAYSGEVPVLWQKVKAAYPHREFIGDPNQIGFGIGAITYRADQPLPEL